MIEHCFAEHMPQAPVAKANATYFAWIDMRKLGMNPRQLGYCIEQEEHIIVENGLRGGKGGGGFVRLNIATSEENISEALRRLQHFGKDITKERVNMGKIVEETRHRESTLLYSLVALLCIVVFMACGYVFLSANFAILLFLGWLIAAAFAMGLGYKFTEIENLAYQSAQKGIGPAAIIMAVGLMIASFMAAGTVPTVLVVGLKSINPSIFLTVAFILCCITSLITGTSWGTIGTVGVAMIGVGAGLGADPAITAGAIVSGAYFGDKMSPLSDSTILASTMTGTELWTHIKTCCGLRSPGRFFA